jgi:hypothetical protein
MTRFAIPDGGTRGLLAASVAALLVVTLCVAACTSEETAPPTQGGASCATGTASQSACSVLPGEYPPPDCDATAKDPGACQGGGCAIDEKKCGAASSCLPLGDNRGRSVLDFRIRRLVFAAPEALAALDFAARVTTPSVDLKSPECGEQGFDSWPWLLRFDRQRKTLTTGGAPPSSDPFKLGYCFFNSERNGFRIGPATDLPVRYDEATRVFSSGAASRLLMPVFVQGDLKNMIVLPISDFAVRNVALTVEDNCIGAFNPRALDGTCKETAACSKWKTAGAMAGHITLEEADKVDIPSLHQSLCALLAKVPPGGGADITRCPRDGSGKITSLGDYCAASNSACDCRDSFWLAATFAASAVRIHDGSSVPECGEP